MFNFKKSLLLAAIGMVAVFGFVACEEEEEPDPDPIDTTSTIFEKSSFTRTLTIGGTATDVTIPTVTITDRSLGIGTRTLDADTMYILNGLVFVNDGQTLTIQPGTIIKGEGGQGENASALVVARGGRINAAGTAAAPIIMTSVTDDIVYYGGAHYQTIPLTPQSRGLWGGLIVLGKADNNNATADKAIEGIPTTETRGLYGGTDDADNSGTIQYVSVRHGGTDIGAGNEINGITLGSVGSGTTIDHVEVYANYDDGIEWFGGTASIKYAVVSFNGDDGYDVDQGHRGNGQFWFLYHSGAGDRGGEWDGDDDAAGTPFQSLTLYNATFIGQGSGAGKRAGTMRANGAAKVYNSIFQGWGRGFDVEETAGSQDSWARYQAGDIVIANNIMWDVAGNFLVSSNNDAAINATLATDLANWGNQTVVDPMLDSEYRSTVNLGAVTTPSNPFFTNANFKGCFEPGQTWFIEGWTRTAVIL